MPTRTILKAARATLKTRTTAKTEKHSSTGRNNPNRTELQWLAAWLSPSTTARPV